MHISGIPRYPALAALHSLQDLVGGVEALGIRVPDLLNQLLGSVVALGGCGYLLLLGRESHARQVAQEGCRVECSLGPTLGSHAI
jgi:uncharacterized membrane protein YccC